MKIQQLIIGAALAIGSAACASGDTTETSATTQQTAREDPSGESVRGPAPDGQVANPLLPLPQGEFAESLAFPPQTLEDDFQVAESAQYDGAGPTLAEATAYYQSVLAELGYDVTNTVEVGSTIVVSFAKGSDVSGSVQLAQHSDGSLTVNQQRIRIKPQTTTSVGGGSTGGSD